MVRPELFISHPFISQPRRKWKSECRIHNKPEKQITRQNTFYKRAYLRYGALELDRCYYEFAPVTITICAGRNFKYSTRYQRGRRSVVTERHDMIPQLQVSGNTILKIFFFKIHPQEKSHFSVRLILKHIKNLMLTGIRPCRGFS